MKVPRSVPDPAPPGSTRPPAYANPNSHWWDASQVYGSDPVIAAKLRTGEGGKLKLEATGLLPVDPVTGIHFSGFTDNWWIGLAMLHTLFTLEHNHICDLLAKEHPGWNDEQLHRKDKLINSAIMAKIHTVEWTPAILPHRSRTVRSSKRASCPTSPDVGRATSRIGSRCRISTIRSGSPVPGRSPCTTTRNISRTFAGRRRAPRPGRRGHPAGPRAWRASL